MQSAQDVRNNLRNFIFYNEDKCEMLAGDLVREKINVEETPTIWTTYRQDFVAGQVYPDIITLILTAAMTRLQFGVITKHLIWTTFHPTDEDNPSNSIRQVRYPLHLHG